MDAETSGSEVGEGEGSEEGEGLTGLTVMAGWGVCRVVSTLIAKLESKVEKEIKTLICRFAVQPKSQLHLPAEVSTISDWGFGGEDGLPLLGRRHAFHSPQDALSSPATVIATSVGA